MNVVTYSFLAFLCISIAVYYIMPKKIRWGVLLVASVLFYGFSGIDNLLIVLATAVCVYIFARLMQKNLDEQAKLVEGLDRKAARVIKDEMKKKRKRFLVLALCCVIGILGFLKYYNFAVQNLNRLFRMANLSELRGMNLIVPLGISFYSFMMIAYLVDVYHGKIVVEKNPLKYLAYVLYFPHVTQGPIARYETLAPQIFEGRKFDYDTVVKGLWLMLWGYFKKLVIADRLAVFVNEVFGSYTEYQGTIFILVGIAYSIQIYCDFSGCMDIVRGASECYGIRLSENFERPYFSQTLPEFWRRWHMSLGNFFKEYVFYPVSTSKLFLKANTNARKWFGNEWGRNIASCIPILSVWLLTGLWHGASWNFIEWGLFHGILICLSTIFERWNAQLTEKLHIRTNCFSWSLFRMVRTFILCMIGRIFFIGSSIGASIHILKSIVVDFGRPSSIMIAGFTQKQWTVVLLSCLCLFLVSLAQEIRKNLGMEGDIRDCLAKQNVWLRWLVLAIGLVVVFTLGKYGTGVGVTFIYEQF